MVPKRSNKQIADAAPGRFMPNLCNKSPSRTAKRMAARAAAKAARKAVAAPKPVDDGGAA